MASSLTGVCYPAGCVHECNCSCHRQGETAYAVHIVACCDECGLCLRNIKIVFKNQHNETCHKPILKKMPHPEPIKKYQSR